MQLTGVVIQISSSLQHSHVYVELLFGDFSNVFFFRFSSIDSSVIIIIMKCIALVFVPSNRRQLK